MNIKEYFENTKGIGILATSDSEGMVDLAVKKYCPLLETEKKSKI